MLLTARYVLPVATPHIEYGAVLVRDDKIVEIGDLEHLQALHPDEPVRDFGLARSCRASSTCTRISSTPRCAGSSTTCRTRVEAPAAAKGAALHGAGLGRLRAAGSARGPSVRHHDHRRHHRDGSVVSRGFSHRAARSHLPRSRDDGEESRRLRDGGCRVRHRRVASSRPTPSA